MKNEFDTGMLDDLLGYHLRRAQATVFGDFMQTMQEHKISPGQFGVLTLIDANTGLNQSALAQAIGIERSTMVAVITALEKRGLLKRTPAPDDKRVNVLSLTDDGLALLSAIRPMVQNHEDTVFKDLTAAERETLRALLRKVTQ